MIMNFCVTFLLNIWLKLKMKLFHKYEQKKVFFSDYNSKFNLEPRTKNCSVLITSGRLCFNNMRTIF